MTYDNLIKSIAQDIREEGFIPRRELVSRIKNRAKNLELNSDKANIVLEQVLFSKDIKTVNYTSVMFADKRMDDLYYYVGAENA